MVMILQRGFWLTTLVLLVSCTHQPLVYEPLENGETIAIEDRLLTLSTLTPDELTERHGINSRYLTDYPGIMPAMRPLVIQLNLEGAGDLSLNNSRVQLISPSGEKVLAKTRDQLFDLWKPHISENQRARVSWFIESNLIGEKITLSDTEESWGYTVFLLPQPRRGRFLIQIPLIVDGKEITVSHPFTVEIDRAVTTEPMDFDKTKVFTE